VSLIPVVHLDSRISPRIFEKIRNGLNGILWGWGETDSWKNQKEKISWHCPFKFGWEHLKLIFAEENLAFIITLTLCTICSICDEKWNTVYCRYPPCNKVPFSLNPSIYYVYLQSFSVKHWTQIRTSIWLTDTRNKCADLLKSPRCK
jgi:hypothetical protein